MTSSIQLNQKNLPRLAGRLACPQYDRSRVRAGIVHIGVGGFHRSHEACYTDALMNSGGPLDWGICGVGLREADRKMREILAAQDYLYALIEKHPDGAVQARIIGSIVDFMLGVDDPGAVIDRMAGEQTRIVSLTITEGGYNFHPVTGAFQFDTPDVQHDLAHPDSPRLVFGYLTAALRKRRDAGVPPFTVQSCDNIQHNGDITRRMLLAFAARLDPELAEWIAREVRFPNAMVDRITPVTTPKDIEILRTTFGLDCSWPVVCEPFRQWVIEDDFANGRPAWEEVGAQFVPDVTPYEKMKIRLLNAGHSVLGLLGSIHGHETIDGAVADPLFARYLRAFMDREATPVLDAVAGIDLAAYKDSLLARFGNPNIEDSLTRICSESSAKLPKFLIATIRENLAAGGDIALGTLVIAAWCFYSDVGLSRHGGELEIIDAMEDALHRAAHGTGDDALAFIRLSSIFGDLAGDQRFATLYAEQVRALYAHRDVARSMTEALAPRPPAG